ncbi:MAG: hypothetical protein CME62_03125 [Halobacteriovoraceae bacterium]|nr:hypothetical protein [Halobacteriovoraceae bacterium]|tara:strand:- start:5558 stop:7051 length:1494 start_codon:yes stop_codon:yes gene_type:complete
MNNSELLAMSIYQQNIKTVFVTKECLHYSLISHLETMGVKIVPCYQSYLAGLMAGAYGNLESNIGVVITDDSPKQVSDLNKCLNSHYFDHNPVLAIKITEKPVCVDHSSIRTNNSPAIVKSNVVFHKKRNIVRTLHDLKDHSLEGTPGPVLLTISTAHLADKINLERSHENFPNLSIFSASSQKIKLFHNVLAEKETALVIGSSLMSQKTMDGIYNLIEMYKLPFVIAPLAKKYLDGEHPYCLGVLDKKDKKLESTLYAKDLLINIGLAKEDWSYLDYGKVKQLENLDSKTINTLGILGQTYNFSKFYQSTEQPLTFKSSQKLSFNLLKKMWGLLPSESFLITGRDEVNPRLFREITPTSRKKLFLTSKNESALLTALVTKITYPDHSIFVVCNAKNFNSQIDLLCLFQHYNAQINILIIKESSPYFKFDFNQRVEGSLSFISHDKIDWEKLKRFNLRVDKLDHVNKFFKPRGYSEDKCVKICEIPEYDPSINVYYE